MSKDTILFESAKIKQISNKEAMHQIYSSLQERGYNAIDLSLIHIYKVKKKTRVFELIEKAGGLKSDANLDALNLSLIHI